MEGGGGDQRSGQGLHSCLTKSRDVVIRDQTWRYKNTEQRSERARQSRLLGPPETSNEIKGNASHEQQRKKADPRRESRSADSVSCRGTDAAKSAQRCQLGRERVAPGPIQKNPPKKLGRATRATRRDATRRDLKMREKEKKKKQTNSTFTDVEKLWGTHRAPARTGGQETPQKVDASRPPPPKKAPLAPPAKQDF